MSLLQTNQIFALNDLSLVGDDFENENTNPLKVSVTTSAVIAPFTSNIWIHTFQFWSMQFYGSKVCGWHVVSSAIRVLRRSLSHSIL